MCKFHVWDIMNGEEWTTHYPDLESLMEDMDAEQVDSHYDAMNERWYFYLRIYNQRTEPQTIMQVYLEEFTCKPATL